MTVRRVVFDTLAAEGRGPSPREIARRAGCTPDEAGRGLAELAAGHALVLTPDGDAVRMAHPFSAAPMAFVVAPLDGTDDRRWWGGCAWDSFGISAALGLDVLIDTACPGCGRRLRVTAGPALAPDALAPDALPPEALPPEALAPDEDLAVWFPLPAARWWDDVVRTCTSIRLCCDQDHARSWAAATGQRDGQVAAAGTVWKLAQPWYGDRLREDFEPHSREHNQALLEGVGLTGPFWRLPSD